MRHALRCLFLLLVLASAGTAQAVLPAFDEVKGAFRSSYAELLDREGRLLHARRVDMTANRLGWVPLEAVSPALVEAVIFAEDRDFHRHHGVDWGATTRAALKLAGGDRSRGASTLTMQLAGLLEPELAWQRGGRSLGRKWRQMRAAQRIEDRWRKPEILEAWLNLVTFRGDLQGIGATSAALFGKAPAGLDRNEAVLLAALLPSPGAEPARVARRACVLIEAGFAGASCEAVRDLAFLRLSRRLSPYPERPSLEALAVRLLTQPGERLRSSLDAGLQQQAEELLAVQLAELAERRVDAGAVVVLDNATGEVRAYVANAGRVPSARFVDGVMAARQAGSTLKPFLYALAFERRYLTAASVLEDAPLSLATPNGIYAPQNYDNDFKGPVSARVALAGSLNVPAVRVLDLVGVEAFWQLLRGAGYDSLTEAPDFYGYALALGSADVNLWMQANAYRVLANGGRHSPATFTPASPAAGARVLGEAAAFVTADILADRGARAITFELDSPLATPFWSAVKTGTSKDMRDNWCIGFSRRHTVAVWVGNLDGAPMHDVSGVSGAAPVWAGVMRALEGGRVVPGGEVPSPPAGLERQRVTFEGLPEPPREEWFVAGTAMSRVEFAPSAAPRIVYPPAGTRVAVDPDIPAARQRLRFRVAGAEAGLAWWLDGRRLGPATDTDWVPRAGEHRLELRGADGRVHDAVTFIVRGSLSR